MKLLRDPRLPLTAAFAESQSRMVLGLLLAASSYDLLRMPAVSWPGRWPWEVYYRDPIANAAITVTSAKGTLPH